MTSTFVSLLLYATGTPPSYTPCYTPRDRGYSYAPAISYYTPYYVPTYTVQYGAQTSPETVELFRLFVGREEARDVRDKADRDELRALLQRVLESGISPPPAKAPVSKHPGLATMVKHCSECHDASHGKGKGDIVFLRGGAFIDEGENLPRVLDAIDPFSPKSKDGKAHMPPKTKMSPEETMAVTSYLNRLPPPDTAKAPKK